MTPEAVFKAYDLLSAIPPVHVVNMRRALDNARRRFTRAGGAAALSTRVTSAWSPEDEALAWLIDITRDCWCLWPIEPRIH